ncbi:MAG: HlyD family efflux transporter periplasmic adaptor subunit [Planctomycetota bacterium]
MSGEAPIPKAVSVVSIESGVPRDETLVSGVVEPYRRSEVSFDVAGLLTEVIDLGSPAEGPQLDGSGELLLRENGEPVREGTILAQLDPTRFQQAVRAAELAIESTDRQIEAIQIELDDVYPARIASAVASVASARADVASAQDEVAAAEAELELARTTVDRDRVLIQSGAIAQSVLDQSESTFSTATASLSQARSSADAAIESERSAQASLDETRANASVREADLNTLYASRVELENDLDRAETDLASCVLRAPFQGRVTDRLIERGSYINAGSPIVELTMETAIKVVVTVSANQERRLELGDRLPVYTSVGETGSSAEPVMGTVFEKSSAADTGTRTFRIGLILPNPVIESSITPIGDDPVTPSDLFPILALPGRHDGALFVNVACLLERDGRPHVLALPDSGGKRDLSDSVQVPQLVPVRLLDEWEQMDTWTLRRIESTPQLEPGTAVVVHPSLGDEEGVTIGSIAYAFRAGDIVRVGLDAALPAEGFWVPNTSVIQRTGDTFVFTVEDGKAREVQVDVMGSTGGLRRIASPVLRDGTSLVTSGMHYLSDGESVTIRSDRTGSAR